MKNVRTIIIIIIIKLLLMKLKLHQCVQKKNFDRFWIVNNNDEEINKTVFADSERNNGTQCGIGSNWNINCLLFKLNDACDRMCQWLFSGG